MVDTVRDLCVQPDIYNPWKQEMFKDNSSNLGDLSANEKYFSKELNLALIYFGT